MRLTLTALGRVWLDVRILETSDPEPADADREGWPVDSQVLASDARIGYVDDVGAGSTYPWE